MTDKSKGIARDGAKKTPQTEFPAHSGMTHVADAGDGSKVRAPGVSRTEAQRALGSDAVGDVTASGGQPKRTQTEAPPHPSADPYRSDRGEHNPASGKAVMDEAVVSGSHLPRKAE
jgi:hypothetical protein